MVLTVLKNIMTLFWLHSELKFITDHHQQIKRWKYQDCGKMFWGKNNYKNNCKRYTEEWCASQKT